MGRRRIQGFIARERDIDEGWADLRFCSVAAAVIGGAVISGVVSSNNADKATDAAKAAADKQAGVAQQQQDIANQEYQRYQDVYQPQEDNLVNQSTDIGSQANQTKAAGDAAASVASQYSGLRDKLNSTPGMNPSSADYLNTVAKIGLSEAADSATAQTGARQTQRDKGLQALTNVVSLGKGLPAAAASGLASASSTLGSNAGIQAGLANTAVAQGNANSAAIGRAGGVLAQNGTIGQVGGWLNYNYGNGYNGSAGGGASAYAPGTDALGDFIDTNGFAS